MPLLLQPPPPLLFFPQPRTSFPTPKTLLLRRRRPPRSLPLSDANLLSAAPNGPHTHLPAVRSYDSDLSSLTLVGAVSPDQALTAAAADGGASASGHISPTMVIQTLSPAPLHPYSTVSTRLFLPAKKVKQRAKNLRSSLTADILSGDASFPDNILAMTFRQVVMHKLWSFKLAFFAPGTERNMDDLATTREDPVNFTVSASDVRLLAAIAEVVFTSSFESAVREHIGSGGGGLFGWCQKPRRMTSHDGTVCLSGLSQGDIVKDARCQVEKFDLAKEEMVNRKGRVKHRLWKLPCYPKLDRDGGPEFSAWANEFVPAYRLQIDGGKYKDADFGGWKKLDDGRWEVLLTHFQMVELANILDMYYEDRYTIPDKQLLCGLTTETSNISRNQYSSWKMLFVTIASGCILISVGVLAQVCWPQLLRAGRASERSSFHSSYGADCCILQSPEATELEALCVSVVKKIKDELNWPGNITFDTNIGAWTGILPTYLRDKVTISEDATSNGVSATNSYDKDVQRHEELCIDVTSPSETNNMDIPATAQDIASYQVVLSADGKIVGFQPTSRVAVNHWSSNPLAKVLYEGKKLSPGFLEPSIKIPRPREVILIELLMSLNPELSFALARLIQ